MLRILLAILALAIASHAAEADFDPLLVPEAEIYNTAMAQLRTARATRMAELRTGYLAHLDAAIAAATAGASGDILRKERDGIATGMVPAADAAFPPEVQAARKMYFVACGRAAFDFAEGKKKLDADYLKALAKLAPKAKGNRVLAAQLAAERRRVASGL